VAENYLDGIQAKHGNERRLSIHTMVVPIGFVRKERMFQKRNLNQIL
jgi:hypothetical protein